MKKTINRLVVALVGMVISFMPFAVNTASATTSNIPLCEITRSLKVGMTGEDVLCLQRYLNWSNHTVASSGPGSPGNETMYFGGLTANAVANWQNSNSLQVLAPLGLTSGTGFWGQASFNYYVTLVRVALGV